MLDGWILLNRHGGRCEVLPSWSRIGCQKKKLGNRLGAVKVPELHWADQLMRHDAFRGENLHAIAICFHTLAIFGSWWRCGDEVPSPYQHRGGWVFASSHSEQLFSSLSSCEWKTSCFHIWTLAQQAPWNPRDWIARNIIIRLAPPGNICVR